MRAWTALAPAVLTLAGLAGGGCATVVVESGSEGEDEENASENADVVTEGDEERPTKHDECSIGSWLPCHNFEWYQGCEETPEGNRWSECVDPCASGCDTPLVLAFDDEPVTFVHAMTGSFDLTGEGQSIATDWPSPATPWLAMDRDGNGAIDDGGELFGSATRLADGRRAADGFVALRELDSDGDGAITPADAAWNRLVVWRDSDADRASKPSELASVSDAGILVISVRDWSSRRCDERGNCEVERAEMRFAGASGRPRIGTVIDVHLRYR